MKLSDGNCKQQALATQNNVMSFPYIQYIIHYKYINKPFKF